MTSTSRAWKARCPPASKSGAIDPFTGPVVDNAGKERLPKGEKASQEWKDKVDFYVKGVEGKVPAGK